MHTHTSPGACAAENRHSPNMYIYIFVYICIYVYIYINVYTCICIHIYTCIYMHTYTHIYIHIHTCSYTCMYIFIHVYTYICTWTHASTPVSELAVPQIDTGLAPERESNGIWRARFQRYEPTLISIFCPARTFRIADIYTCICIYTYIYIHIYIYI